MSARSPPRLAPCAARSPCRTPRSAISCASPGRSSTNVPDCARRVIDISGDGDDNAGTRPEAERLFAERQGITINALAIESLGLSITNYYRQRVITRDGFVMTSRGHSTYAETLKEKDSPRSRAGDVLREAPAQRSTSIMQRRHGVPWPVTETSRRVGSPPPGRVRPPYRRCRTATSRGSSAGLAFCPSAGRPAQIALMHRELVENPAVAHRDAVPPRAFLLHAPARSRSDAARHLRRLAAEGRARRAHRRRALRDPGARW